MATKLELMLEAERRGILSAEKQAILAEARRRGLVGRSAGETIRQGATFAAQGANRGLANTVGAPVDAANFLLGQMGLGSENPVGGSRMFTEGLESVGATTDIENVPEEFRPFFKGGEVVGESIPFAAAPLAAARAGMTGGRFLAPVVNSAARSPGTFTTIEGLGIAGAAAGRGVAESVAPGDDLVGVGAEIAGGTLAPFRLVATIARNTTGTVRRAIQSRTQAGVRREAGRVARGAVESLGEDPDALAKQLTEPGAGTSAQKTGSPSLLAIERKMVSESARLGGDVAAETERAIRETNTAFREAAATGDPEVLRQVALQQKRYHAALLETRIQSARQKAIEATDNLRSSGSRKEANLVARREMDDALDDARKQERQLWERVDRDIPVEPNDTIEAWEDVRGRLLDEETLPAPVDAALRRFSETGEVTSGDILRLRSRLLAMARTARGQGNFDLSSQLTQIANGALDDLSRLGGDAVDIARTYSRELNDAFTRGGVAELLGHDVRGGQRVADELTLEKSLRGGGPEADVAARQQREAAGFQGAGGPEAAAARQQRITEAQDQFLRNMASEIVNPLTGQVSPERIAAFRRKNAELLSNFRELDSALQNAQAAQGIVNRTVGQLERGQKVIKDMAAFSKVAGVEDPAVAFRAAMKGNNPRRDLTNLYKLAQRGGAEAVAGARASLADAVFSEATRGSQGLISGRAMREIIADKNGPVRLALKQGIISKAHVDNLLKVADRSEKIERAMSGAAGLDAVIDDPDAITDLIIRVAGANVGGAGAAGRISGAPIVAAQAGSRFAQKIFNKVPQAKVKDVLIEAVRNPKLMAELLSEPTTDFARRRSEKQINAFLLQAGIISEDQ